MSSFSSRPGLTRINKHQNSPFGMRFFIISSFVILLTIVYLVWSVGSVTIPKGKYIIEKGYTTAVLSDKLGFDIASWRYRLWVRFFAPSTIDIQAGTYEASMPISLSGFLTKVMLKPLYSDQSITILPGWNSYDIDVYLDSKNIGQVGDFLDAARINFSVYQRDFPFLSGVTSLEGFLYPDTYRLRQGATTDDAIRVMLREFGKKIGPTYLTLTQQKAYQTLILASILEREERNTKNQSIVAGILQKRFLEGMPLGADATVCYGYAKTQKQCTPSFIGSVIQNKNPYNTRSKKGYTPTPIASIAFSTWNAAMHPEASPYYYYLHGTDGQIHYGKTNDEHNTNKIRYLQ